MAKREAVSDHGMKPAWTERAQLLRVMAHPVRLMVLEALADRSQCVKELNSLVPIIQPHLSQHIAALRKAKLVDCHARGTLRCYYLLRPALVRRMIRLLREKHPPRLRTGGSVLREIQQAPRSRARGDRGPDPPA
jgi:ArsR family transcriptional regulator